MNFSTRSSPAISEDLLSHLALERVSVQWSGFLRVLSEELLSKVSQDEYRRLLSGMGRRFAQATALPPCDSLVEIELAVNKLWAQLRWGYATFADNGNSLHIEHFGCPLPAALQIDANAASGFLEGAYAHWLQLAGAPTGLSLSALAPSGRPLHMAFDLTAR